VGLFTLGDLKKLLSNACVEVWGYRVHGSFGLTGTSYLSPADFESVLRVTVAKASGQADVTVQGAFPLASYFVDCASMSAALATQKRLVQRLGGTLAAQMDNLALNISISNASEPLLETLAAASFMASSESTELGAIDELVLDGPVLFFSPPPQPPLPPTAALVTMPVTVPANGAHALIAHLSQFYTSATVTGSVVQHVVDGVIGGDASAVTSKVAGILGLAFTDITNLTASFANATFAIVTTSVAQAQAAAASLSQANTTIEFAFQVAGLEPAQLALSVDDVVSVSITVPSVQASSQMSAYIAASLSSAVVPYGVARGAATVAAPGTLKPPPATAAAQETGNRTGGSTAANANAIYGEVVSPSVSLVLVLVVPIVVSGFALAVLTALICFRKTKTK